MPILDTSFTCPNGHPFKANAKVRARCPQCGALAKRNFSDTPPSDLKPDDPPSDDNEPKLKNKKPILVRQGRPRSMPPKPVAKNKSPEKKITIKKPVKSLGRTASGIVKTHRVTKIQTPKVTRPPKRTAIARHIQTPRKESVIDSVMRRYGPG